MQKSLKKRDRPRKVAKDPVAKRITDARLAAGLSRSELAAMLGVDPSTVTGWENGKFRPRDGQQRSRLAAALGIDASELRHGAQTGDERDSVRLIDSLEDFPARLTKMLDRTRRIVKDARLAAPYVLPPNVQVEFRRKIAARILDHSLEVHRIEIFYDLARLKEVLANILRYHGCKYHVRSFCPGLKEVVPAFGAYVFDDAHVFLGAYWSSVPPHNRPGLLLQGHATRMFFAAYWDEIWRRGAPLNLGGADDLSAVQSLAHTMGLPSGEWPAFVEEARTLTSPDGAPLRI